jgi:hypothetical protein
VIKTLNQQIKHLSKSQNRNMGNKRRQGNMTPYIMIIKEGEEL